MTEVKEQIADETTVSADEIQQLREQIAELSDKYLRARAEAENTKRRASIDCDAAARTRAMLVAENFLPLIDAIDAAFAHAPDDSGIQTMASAAGGALAKVGILKIESVGQKLNPQFHNAVSTVETDDAESGIITEELQTGYMFGDTVLRTAMVIVAK
ncbi:MAG: nucleotide exchange factor GrpE [Alphaproteobacteria bacterium]|nr:nucleotide exchange factor GrpE [Alphaproteobacteria bacterium]